MTFTQRRAGVATPIRLRGRNGTGTVKPRTRTPDPPPVTPSGDTVYSAEPLGAGGWVTGLAISPDGLTRLARTDTLGAWRWDSTADKWVASVTSTSMPAGHGDMDSGEGVNAIGVANGVAFMGYRGNIYKSVDRGQHWTVSLTPGPATAPNTSDQRWWNPHMAIDSADATVCIYGTYSSGLWYTTNAGTSWTQVANGTVPFGVTNGIPCVAIDGSGNWYAAPFGSGLYQSTNRGGSWTKISGGQFVMVSGLAVADNGDIIVCGGTDTSLTAGSSVVYRYRSGTWTNITPAGGRKWRAVAVDPRTAGRLMVHGEGGYIRFSLDYGTTWLDATRQFAAADTDVPWLPNANGIAQQGFFVTIGGVQFDPVVANRVWNSQGIGAWYADLTTTLTDMVTWQASSRGIEQLVVNDAITPPGGAPVIVSWDRAIFLAGETSSSPVITAAATLSTPSGTPATLATTLVSGFPRAITYAWTILSAPSGGSGAFADPVALSTVFTPDHAGSYVLRLTATNAVGAGHADVPLTVTGAISQLLVPASGFNYVTAPHRADQNITGDLTLIVKMALDTWQPASSSNIPLIAKNWALRLNNQGLSMQLPTNTAGSTGAFGNATGALPFAPGSVNWCRLAYNSATQFCTLSTSPDGTTWTVRANVNIASTMAGLPLATSTTPLAIGHQGGNLQPFAIGKFYRGQVWAGATLVADFNAEAVTRTGTRLPATITDSTGLVWTPQGTGWDWA